MDLSAGAHRDGEDRHAVRMSTNVTNMLCVHGFIAATNLLSATMDSVRIQWEATSVTVIQDMDKTTVQRGRAVLQNLARMEASAISILLGIGGPGHLHTQSDVAALLPSVVPFARKKTTA